MIETLEQEPGARLDRHLRGGTVQEAGVSQARKDAGQVAEERRIGRQHRYHHQFHPAHVLCGQRNAAVSSAFRLAPCFGKLMHRASAPLPPRAVTS